MLPQDADDVDCRDYHNRMLIFLDLAIGLEIDKTGRHKHTELPVTQP
jgi:hypothetical protein